MNCIAGAQKTLMGDCRTGPWRVWCARFGDPAGHHSGHGTAGRDLWRSDDTMDGVPGPTDRFEALSMSNPLPAARAGRFFGRTIQRFARDQSGAIAIYFALSAIVLIGVAGLA